MIEYLEKNFGKKTGSSIFFFFIALVTVNIPDWDLATGKLLLHRSIVTHSIFIPFLIDYYSKKYSSKQYPLIIAAIYFAFMVHLSADLFPKSWKGYALISVPFIGWIGPLSPIWIFANVIACGYFCLKIIKENSFSFYPYHFYLTAGICILLYFLKGEDIRMIPIAVLTVDYFGEKKIFSYFPKLSSVTEKSTQNLQIAKRKASSFFSGVYKFFKFIFYLSILLIVLFLVYYGITLFNDYQKFKDYSTIGPNPNITINNFDPKIITYMVHNYDCCFSNNEEVNLKSFDRSKLDNIVNKSIYEIDWQNEIELLDTEISLKLSENKYLISTFSQPQGSAHIRHNTYSVFSFIENKIKIIDHKEDNKSMCNGEVSKYKLAKKSIEIVTNCPAYETPYLIFALNF